MVEEGSFASDREQTVPPVGDFVALVGGFLAFIFPAFLTYYTLEGYADKVGVKTVVGIISFMTGVAVFIAAMFVLIGRFRSPDFRTARSPGWAYGAGSVIIFMTTVLGLVVTPKAGGMEYTVNSGIIVELFAAAIIGVGGLLKF